MAGMFSTKGMYALRAMADLAAHDGWVSLGDVSRRQNISRKYLEQVISLMHKAGYVTSQRGTARRGGVARARELPRLQERRALSQPRQLHHRRRLARPRPRDGRLPRLQDARGPHPPGRRGPLHRQADLTQAPDAGVLRRSHELAYVCTLRARRTCRPSVFAGSEVAGSSRPFVHASKVQT